MLLVSGPFFNNGEARPPSGNRCSEDPTREKKQNASPNRRKNKAAVRQTSFTGVICARTEAAGSSSVFSSWLYGVGCRADRRRQKLLLVSHDSGRSWGNQEIFNRRAPGRGDPLGLRRGPASICGWA